MKILGISGSIVGQKTKTAVKQILENITKKNPQIEIELLSLAQYQIEFSDGRDFRDYNGDTKMVIEKITAADAYIIGTPTYQASIPGTLKNLLDLLPVDTFKNKVIGLIATAGSEKHYSMLEYHLKPVLSYMNAIVVAKYVFIEERHYLNGEIVEDDIKRRLNHLTEDTMDLINVVQNMLKAKDDEYPF